MMKLKIEQGIALYLEQITSVDNRSMATLDSYGTQLNQLKTWLNQKNIDYVNDITIDDLFDFIYGYDHDHAPSSTNHMITVIRSFYDYLHEYYGLTNIALQINLKKADRKEKKILNDSAIERLLTIDDESNEKEYANVTILETIYGCGLRVSECTGLTMNQLHLDDGTISVVGKGNKTRVIPLSDTSRHRLIHYLDFIRPKWNKNHLPNVFITKAGKPLQRNLVYTMLKKRLLDKGIVANSGALKGLSPHSLRHALATHMVNQDTDPRIVQQILGHESIATTQIYTHKTVDELQKTYDQCMPRS